ncbi:hypothetical protein DSBG_2204 [Desulfosporosinus sp. BG]|nr:hypothetical protein DSBG_2204 [Desulfosporosinus sp. BG]
MPLKIKILNGRIAWYNQQVQLNMAGGHLNKKVKFILCKAPNWK